MSKEGLEPSSREALHFKWSVFTISPLRLNIQNKCIQLFKLNYDYKIIFFLRLYIYII